MARDTEYQNVFEDLGFGDEEATNLRARSELMIAITERIRKNEWSQMEAAKRLNTSQPRISDLMRGHIDRFSVDMLMNFATDCGLQVNISVEANDDGQAVQLPT